MASFQFNGRGFYIDGRLAKQYDEKIIPDLQKKDKDVVFIVDGGERKGKSVFTMIQAAYLASKFNTPFNLSNICMEPLEFRDKVRNAVKNEVIIYDEAHRGMASRRALSEINNMLVDLMIEMGQKNLCVFIVLPSIFLLDKYPALFRSRGLFHIYERNGQRGFWVYFNEKNKLKLYIKGKKEFNYNCVKWPMFRGRFLDQYPVDEEAYRKKKKEAFEKKPELTKGEVYKNQRDMLLYILHKELNLGAINLAKLLQEYKVPLKKTIISEILAKLRV